MIHVIATITVGEGQRSAFLEQFNWVVPHVRAEDGCLEYGAAIDTPTPLAVQEAIRPDTVVVVEKWASVAHLQAHLKAPHMDEYRQRVKDFVTGVSLQVLAPASP
ncbi:MAG: antibiotic biosynthesis monooxygenase [Bacteroidales bacterium]|nr:antibiotic biosynthesis monooxygenase [Bacteroidales bacterium]